MGNASVAVGLTKEEYMEMLKKQSALEAELAQSKAELKRTQDILNSTIAEKRGFEKKEASLTQQLTSLFTTSSGEQTTKDSINKENEKLHIQVEILEKKLLASIDDASVLAKKHRIARNMISDMQMELEQLRAKEREYTLYRIEHTPTDDLVPGVGGVSPANVPKNQRMNRFGIPLTHYVLEDVPGYRSGIPRILVWLQKQLIRNNGLLQLGIFRMTADLQVVDSAKTRINKGELIDIDDPYVAATLIGTWFRELPTPILGNLTHEDIAVVDSDEVAWKTIYRVAEPQQSILRWLLDLCVQVSKNVEQNKMSAKNLAIVFAPNLFSFPPMPADNNNNNQEAEKVMLYTKQAGLFLEMCIAYRAEM